MSVILSLIVPAYNEEDVVATFLEHVLPCAEEGLAQAGLEPSLEVIFVDDGSSDKTADIITELSATDPRLKLVKLSRNFGKDAALAAGLQHASGAAVVPMDVDLQDPPEILGDMLRLWQEGALVVNARRSNRDSDSRVKRLTSEYFYRIYNRISKQPIDANVGDYRLLDRKAVNVINDMPERIRFMKGLFSWVGFRKDTVEYTRAERVAGQTKWRYWGLWNFALDGITASTTLPLRIWSYVGITTAMMSLIYALVIVGKTILFGSDVPGYASLMVVVLLFGSLNMIALGIIGEYVGRIAIEVRQRPIYVVDELIGFEETMT